MKVSIRLCSFSRRQCRFWKNAVKVLREVPSLVVLSENPSQESSNCSHGQTFACLKFQGVGYKFVLSNVLRETLSFMGGCEDSQVLRHIAKARRKNVKVLRVAVNVLSETVEVYGEADSFCCSLRSFEFKGLEDQTSSWKLKGLVEES